MNELKNYLKQFGGIKNEVYEDLMRCFYPMELDKNSFFTKEGEVAKKIGFLRNGIIRAYFKDINGKEFTKQFFVGPSIVGAYTSLVTKQPNLIYHQALTRCDIIVAEYRDILNLYQKYHSLETVGRTIAEYYYVEKEQKLIEQAVLDAEKRYRIFQDRFPSLENSIPQYHIASYIGISPTQLSRIRGRKK